MNEKITKLKNNLSSLGLTSIIENIENYIIDSEKKSITFLDYTLDLTNRELKCRQQKASNKRIKDADFPFKKTLDDFDINFCKSLSIRQFTILKQMTWIDGLYNLIFAGPPGVGKTHLAIALGYEACLKGYKVSYTTMQNLIHILTTKDIDRRSKVKIRKIYSSNLFIIDEVGYLPINKQEGNLFFQLISDIHGQCSTIITTNKSFEKWTEFLGDAALATAILDRIAYRCDRINFSGKSYRLENRKSFLSNDNT